MQVVSLTSGVIFCVRNNSRTAIIARFISDEKVSRQYLYEVGLRNLSPGLLAILLKSIAILLPILNQKSIAIPIPILYFKSIAIAIVQYFSQYLSGLSFNLFRS